MRTWLPVALVLGMGIDASAQDDRPGKWGEDEHQSRLVPALEIAGFEVLLNLYDRHFDEFKEDYQTNWGTIRDNVQSGWIIDRDPFAMNQFLHPVHGSIVHGFARSAGLGYWEALVYDFGGSVLWEVAGETGRPSANDLITTTFAGSFLGEALFRMSSLILEGADPGPGGWRQAAAGIVCPPAGFNRLAFDRFDPVFPSHGPDISLRAGIGGRRNDHIEDVRELDDAPGDKLMINFSLMYGHPGKEGYDYERPFDYFEIEAATTSDTGSLPENVLIRGLVYGAEYDQGEDFQGIWGLYGTYDYISPELFSVSSTALAVGTTIQWRMSKAVRCQSTVLAGIGWTAVGTLADAEEDRDFHYAYSPQGMAALRFLFGDVAMLDFAGREYYVGGLGAREETERENIWRMQIQLIARVAGHHGIGVQFVSTVRESTFDVAEGLESVGALSIFYTYLGDPDFGLVK